ncbi:unnamed protein product [Soboliphyme baturini]|uniref:Protein kinase domain-containing protein n=1 Tax=Soboliphyme baturini TaxID=241478 RepID=A0A183IJZ7_9BILA|nr:unnamed protein product [Soboliphyme baturini]
MSSRIEDVRRLASCSQWDSAIVLLTLVSSAAPLQLTTVKPAFPYSEMLSDLINHKSVIHRASYKALVRSSASTGNCEPPERLLISNLLEVPISAGSHTPSVMSLQSEADSCLDPRFYDAMFSRNDLEYVGRSVSQRFVWSLSSEAGQGRSLETETIVLAEPFYLVLSRLRERASLANMPNDPATKVAAVQLFESSPSASTVVLNTSYLRGRPRFNDLIDNDSSPATTIVHGDSGQRVGLLTSSVSQSSDLLDEDSINEFEDSVGDTNYLDAVLVDGRRGVGKGRWALMARGNSIVVGRWRMRKSDFQKESLARSLFAT